MEGRADLGSREGEEGREGNGAPLPLGATKEGDPGKINRSNSLAPVFLTESSKKKQH